VCISNGGQRLESNRRLAAFADALLSVRSTIGSGLSYADLQQIAKERAGRF
jgi:hypothetical protein